MSKNCIIFALKFFFLQESSVFVGAPLRDAALTLDFGTDGKNQGKSS